MITRLDDLLLVGSLHPSVQFVILPYVRLYGVGLAHGVYFFKKFRNDTLVRKSLVS